MAPLHFFIDLVLVPQYQIEELTLLIVVDIDAVVVLLFQVGFLWEIRGLVADAGGLFTTKVDGEVVIVLPMLSTALAVSE